MQTQTPKAAVVYLDTIYRGINKDGALGIWLAIDTLAKKIQKGKKWTYHAQTL